jgi:hypothetical protein
VSQEITGLDFSRTKELAELELTNFIEYSIAFEAKQGISYICAAMSC